MNILLICSLTIPLLWVFGWVIGRWRWWSVRWCVDPTGRVLLQARRAETSIGVAFRLGWGAAGWIRLVLRVWVWIISILKLLSLTGAHSMTGLRAWCHGSSTRVRRQVLGRWHRHKSHSEMTPKWRQIPNLPDCCRGGIFIVGAMGDGNRERKIREWEKKAIVSLWRDSLWDKNNKFVSHCAVGIPLSPLLSPSLLFSTDKGSINSSQSISFLSLQPPLFTLILSSFPELIHPPYYCTVKQTNTNNMYTLCHNRNFQLTYIVFYNELMISVL